MTNKKSSKKKKSYLGKVGVVSFGGIQVEVKVLEEKTLAGRTHVLITPTKIKNGAQVWKNDPNIVF